MRFYWLEIKKARPLWAYFVGFALLGLVAYGTGYSFIGTNGDIIDQQQVAQSTWISACTQLYCLMLGPIIVSILAAGLAKAEIQGGVVQLYKSRGRYAQRKISALIVVFGVFGAALSVTLLAGWLAALGSHGAIFGNSFPPVAIFAFRNVLAVIAWGLIRFAIYAWIRDTGVGFTVCLGIMLVGLGILVSSSKVAQYNPILPFAGAVGYPFPDYSLLSWLPLLIGLGIGFVAVSMSWKHLLARPEKENEMLSTPKTVYQQTGRDCLLACYTSVLDSLSKQVNVAQLIDYDRLNADGFAFAELRNYEKDHGVDINGF